MKRTIKFIHVILLVFLLVFTCAMVSLADDNTRFVPGTAVNGISIGNLTVEEATEKINQYYTQEYKLELVRKGGTSEFISGADIGYQAQAPAGLQTILDQQNAGGRITGPAAGSLHTLAVSGTFHMEALRDKVQGLSCVSGDSVKITSDARISGYEAGQDFRIIPEVQGNNVDVEKVVSAVAAALGAGQESLNLNDAGCYVEVKVTSTDAGLQNLCNIMNQCRTMTITYKIGDTREILSGETIVTWLTGAEDGQIGVNRDSAATYIKTLADSYDTAGRTRVFHTTSGEDKELTGPYGWKINQAAETDAVIGMIRTGQTQEREPAYSRTAVSRTGPEWGNTYVEIDLAGQHVYMYKDGAVVWDAPCVTGNVSKEYTTPPGLYSLNYKERDRVLRGEKQPDGTYEYESPVSFWMPFNGGIGLHDANWRSKFGGSIYQTNGSHGCVNLPPSKTQALYDMVYTGIPVICHN